MAGILDILANPLVLFAIAVPVFLFVGILVGTWLSQPRKNRVLKVSPESGMGVEYEVASEDSVNAYCDPVGDTPPQRFIKRHQALNILRKGFFKLTNYALWFGRYGTAYTYMVKGKETVEVTLRDAIHNIFGKELYDKIPNDEKTGYVKDQIEKSSVGVTVKFPNEPLTPEDLPSISEDDISRDNDERAMQNLWNEYKSTTSGDVFKIIFILGTGIGIGIVLALIFGWGAPVIISGA